MERARKAESVSVVVDKDRINVNIVLYSHREPYTSTKNKLIETISKFTSENVIIHDYDLRRIMKSSWWDKIKELPNIKDTAPGGRRDGYYNCWKPFIVNEVYENMNDGDVLYYVDSSRYYRYGFTENIDNLCNLVLKKGIVAGSVGKNVKNNSYNCCNNINVWNKILPKNDNSVYLDKSHVLNSWFILVKNDMNTDFINEWCYWSIYIDDEFEKPLVTYHHTADQSIFNILVYKYNFNVFYNKQILHDRNKDRNVVLKIINDSSDPNEYFIEISKISYV
jgi:hypothetical protein